MTADSQERTSHTGLGRALMSAGILTADWAPFYAAVPRSLFLPETIWPFDMEQGTSITVSRTQDPETWQDYALSDVPIVTQWDDGEHTGPPPGTVPTSSASMPSVVFSMLSALDVQPGDHVLEIGTGTGWSAALLAHRLGADRVTTVEVDPAVRNSARSALRRAGYFVGSVCADGADGFAPRAPYPRIIATCAVRTVPPAWIEQCTPGGTIVTPWGTHWGNGDAVVKLVAAADRQSATGHFTGPVEFMKLRDQRQPAIRHRDYVTPDTEREAREARESDVTADQFLEDGDRFSPLQFTLGLRVPHCVRVVAAPEGDRQPVWLYSLTDRSWACALFTTGRPTQIWESGPRRLWAEVESAHVWWTGHGRPGHDRFGLTVTPHTQTAWLDTPDHHWAM